MGFQVNICGKKLDEKGVKALLAAMAVVTAGHILYLQYYFTSKKVV